METPHYSVLRVRKGEESKTLSYMPKRYEEEMAVTFRSSEYRVERKRPEQPALATFVMPDYRQLRLSQLLQQPRCKLQLLNQ